MIINCAVYERGRKRADIHTDDIRHWLQQPDCFVWVALHDPGAAELAQMQDEFGLHELAVEDAHKGHQRPKMEEYGNTLFVVMHLLDSGVQLDSDEPVGALAVFAGETFVLLVRTRSSHGFQDVRQRCEREPELLQSLSLIPISEPTKR